MALQIRPSQKAVAPGMTGAISGAAGAAQGFMQAQDIYRRQENERLELDANMRRLMLAERNQELQLQRFFENQRRQQAKQDREVAGDEAAAKAFESMRGALGLGQAGKLPKSAGGNLPQAFDQDVANISGAVRSGGMSPAEGMQALKIVGTRYEAAIQKLNAEELSTTLMDEIARGDWNPEAVTGVQMDVDGDGDPDPISDTPALLIQALKEGVDPQMIGVLHERARQAYTDAKAKFEWRNGKGAEYDTKLKQMAGTLTPEGYAAATSIVDKWMRDQYPHTEQGMKEFDRDFNMATQGMMPLVDEKDGMKSYVPREQFLEAKHKLEAGADPEFQRIEDETALVSKVVGEFRPPSDITDPKEINSLWQQYLGRLREAKEALGVTPPANKGMMPSRAGALTGGAPRGTKPPPLTEQMYDAKNTKRDSSQKAIKEEHELVGPPAPEAEPSNYQDEPGFVGPKQGEEAPAPAATEAAKDSAPAKAPDNMTREQFMEWRKKQREK